MTTVDTIPRTARGGAAERPATAHAQLLALLDELSFEGDGLLGCGSL